MIKFYDSQITQIIPEHLRHSPEVQAVSYAVMKANQRLQDYAHKTSIYAIVEQLPDHILDMLAVELRAQYYDEALPVETKRGIIKNTMLWYHTAGTPSAVEELITIAFGGGRVIEWFEFGGDPGTFDIESYITPTEEMFALLSSAISKVKNTRSHLRQILSIRELFQKVYFGGTLSSGTHIKMDESAQIERRLIGYQYEAAGCCSYNKIVIGGG